MAANTNPIFILTGFGSPATVSTVNADVTGASGSFDTVITGGTNGSLVTAIIFRAVTNTAGGTQINIFHKSSTTYRNIGRVVVPGGIDPSKGQELEIQWTNANGAYPLKASDSIVAAQMNGTTVFHARPIGGDY